MGFVLRTALAGFAMLAGACGGAGRSNPVLIVGIDGLEPAVVARLLAEGRLPTLASFARAGVVGRIESMVPTYSPVIWTTIATGQLAEAHGIDFFHDGQGKPFTSNAREVPALWNLVSDAGRTVNCVGWWNTWPAETVNGRMLSSYAAQAQAEIIWKPGVWENLEDQVWPPDLLEEIEPAMVFSSDVEEVRDRLYRAFPRPGSLDPITEKSVTDLGWTYAADLTAANVTVLLQREHPADLTLAYLALPDVAGHRFWSYHEPDAYGYEVPEPARSDFATYVEAAHIEADRLLGQILAAAPDDANVLVLSDHGMHADDLDDPTTGQSGHHRDGPPGLFAARGPQVRSLGSLLGDPASGTLGHVLEVAPLALRLLGVEVPEHWLSLRAQSELASVLDEAWSAANPVVTGPNPDPSFRPATPSRLPAADLDKKFNEAFSKLGYAVGE